MDSACFPIRVKPVEHNPSRSRAQSSKLSSLKYTALYPCAQLTMRFYEKYLKIQRSNSF